MELLEVGKGCGRGCRFCLEGQVYRPGASPEPRIPARVGGEDREGVQAGRARGRLRVRLPVDRRPDEACSRRTGSRCPSPRCAPTASPRTWWRRSSAGGHRTLTMAPEAGTERLRRVVRKAITDEQLFEACDLLRRYGIPNLKCYFMIGLPTETREDIEAIPDLAARLLERLRVPGARRPLLRQADAVGVLLRAQAVDAVPVGAVRRSAGARGEARHHQAGGPSARHDPGGARESARGGAPGPARARRPTGGRLRGAGRRARRRLAPRAPRLGRRPGVLHAAAPGARPRSCRGTTSTSGVKKAGLLREWERAPRAARSPAAAVR